MGMAMSFSDYLDKKHLSFDIIDHPRTSTTTGSAISAGVAPFNMAKAVVFSDDKHNTVMAVLPASKKIRQEWLEDLVQNKLHMLSEDELASLFPDCELGCIPPTGEPYNIKTIYDISLSDVDDVYMEGGDHSTLIHMQNSDFKSMIGGCRQGDFSSNYDRW